MIDSLLDLDSLGSFLLGLEQLQLGIQEILLNLGKNKKSRKWANWVTNKDTANFRVFLFSGEQTLVISNFLGIRGSGGSTAVERTPCNRGRGLEYRQMLFFFLFSIFLVLRP